MRLFSSLSCLRIPICAVSIIATLISSGCKDAVYNSGEDNSFLQHIGTSSETKNKVKAAPGPLLPINPGASWRNRIRFLRIVGSPDGNRDPTVDENGVPFQTVYEKTVISRLISLPGGGTGVRLEMHQDRQSKINRTENYKIDKKGIALSEIHGTNSVIVSPPMPIIRYPVKEDSIEQWNGTVRLDNKTYPARGYSRVGSPQEIVLPQGKMTAYRIDTSIITTIEGRPVSIPMIRWISPGVGIVKQRFIDGNLQVTKEVVSYKI